MQISISNLSNDCKKLHCSRKTSALKMYPSVKAENTEMKYNIYLPT